MHRLIHKAYPITGQQTVSRLPINQFRLSIQTISPGLETDADFHEVMFAIDNSNGIMEPTYYDGTAIFSTGTENVLAIPQKAVHTRGEEGRPFVYSIDGESRLIKKAVAIGIVGEGFVEITAGLEKGDPVVMADPADYSEGMKVGVKHYEPDISAKSS